MTMLEFFAQLISSLAWPCSAFGAILLLRKPISDLLLELRRLKWKNLEAEFGRDLGYARDIVDANLPNPQSFSSAEKEAEKDNTYLTRLAELSPRSAVMEAWREVEAAATRVLRDRNLIPKHAPSSALAGKALIDTGLLDDTQFQVFSILRNLRNRAAHEGQFDISKADAVEYAIVARRLIEALGAQPS